MGQRTSTGESARPVVWVVGASRGIGKEIALQFAMTGCRVCLSSRSARPLGLIARDITVAGGLAEVFRCDIGDVRDVRRTASAIERKFGRIDALVLNAGATSFSGFLETSDRELDGMMRTNLTGPLHCLRAVLPGMVRRRNGWIGAVLTTAALKTYTGSSVYSASKAGLRAALNVIREELRTSNIRVVSLFPGATETAMWPSAIRKRHGKRMMRPAGVAEVFVDLFHHPSDVVPEEIVLRPPLGDIG